MLLAALAVVVGAADARAAKLKPVGEFDRPIYVTAPPGDDRRLFVVEREGTVRVIRKGRVLPRPFLRIPGGVSTEQERGLSSLAFAPDYRESRRLYVFYSTPTDGDPKGGDIRVDEFMRARKRPNRALAGSQRRVLGIEHTRYATHYGGQLQFGPDGLLHISTGDGGGHGDPMRNGQDTGSLLGKILRIDPRERGARDYSVPGSNPFVGTSGAREIFALGLRNPFRFSFDRGTGALAIADVGQNEIEEVNLRRPGQRPGANFGWNCYEGSRRYRGNHWTEDPCLAEGTTHVRPVLERSHSAGDCSVIGGYVARHGSLGPLQGRYVYGDFCTGVIRSAELRPRGAIDDRPVRGAALPPYSLVSFGEDAAGRIYVVSQHGGVYWLRG